MVAASENKWRVCTAVRTSAVRNTVAGEPKTTERLCYAWSRVVFLDSAYIVTWGSRMLWIWVVYQFGTRSWNVGASLWRSRVVVVWELVIWGRGNQKWRYWVVGGRIVLILGRGLEKWWTWVGFLRMLELWNQCWSLFGILSNISDLWWIRVIGRNFVAKSAFFLLIDLLVLVD